MLNGVTNTITEGNTVAMNEKQTSETENGKITPVTSNVINNFEDDTIGQTTQKLNGITNVTQNDNRADCDTAWLDTELDGVTESEFNENGSEYCMCYGR